MLLGATIWVQSSGFRVDDWGSTLSQLGLVWGLRSRNSDKPDEVSRVWGFLPHAGIDAKGLRTYK